MMNTMGGEVKMGGREREKEGEEELERTRKQLEQKYLESSIDETRS